MKVGDFVRSKANDHYGLGWIMMNSGGSVPVLLDTALNFWHRRTQCMT